MDLERIAQQAPELASSGLAAAALCLAETLDDSRNSATSRSMCAKALLDVMDRLRELCPPERKRDRIDDLAARRERRRNTAAAS